VARVGKNCMEWYGMRSNKNFFFFRGNEKDERNAIEWKKGERIEFFLNEWEGMVKNSKN